MHENRPWQVRWKRTETFVDIFILFAKNRQCSGVCVCVVRSSTQQSAPSFETCKRDEVDARLRARQQHHQKQSKVTFPAANHL